MSTAASPLRPASAGQPADAAQAVPVRPSRLLRATLLVNLVAQVGIVLTGGLVRLTGSGLGCPTWPQCVPGSYTPVLQQPQGWHKDVEFGNRLLTFVVGVAAIASLVLVWRFVRRWRPAAPRRLLVLGAVPLLGVFAQAVLGGVTVLTGLSPATVAAHFLLSMVLVAASTVLYLSFAAPTRAAGVRREIAQLGWAVAALAAVVLVLGTVVTGSGPHSGDAQRPTRFGFDPATVSWLHADAVWLFVGLVVALLVALRLSTAPVASRRAGVLLVVTLLQGAVGYVQYATDLPVALVAAHVLGASSLVVAVTAVVVALTGTPAARTLAPAPR
ncbi:MAG TPA: COX15/CtaA family protein [Kineosporiaceae bacterium]|jgi:cytochrome c oxidase assembly protein subunit 15|nr:COX15/CtaA family protein [Kineosporiaceae bacterium]